jgi:hypothetical protein
MAGFQSRALILIASYLLPWRKSWSISRQLGAKLPAGFHLGSQIPLAIGKRWAREAVKQIPFIDTDGRVLSAQPKVGSEMGRPPCHPVKFALVCGAASRVLSGLSMY